MLTWNQIIFFMGAGGLLSLIGFFLLISQPWPTTWESAKTWLKRTVSLASIICLSLGIIFVLIGALSML